MTVRSKAKAGKEGSIKYSLNPEIAFEPSIGKMVAPKFESEARVLPSALKLSERKLNPEPTSTRFILWPALRSQTSIETSSPSATPPSGVAKNRPSGLSARAALAIDHRLEGLNRRITSRLFKFTRLLSGGSRLRAVTKTPLLQDRQAYAP